MRALCVLFQRSWFLLSSGRQQCSAQRCPVSAFTLAGGCSFLGCQVCLCPPGSLAGLWEHTSYSDSNCAQIIYLPVLCVWAFVLWLHVIGPDCVKVLSFCLIVPHAPHPSPPDQASITNRPLFDSCFFFQDPCHVRSVTKGDFYSKEHIHHICISNHRLCSCA